ncbi:hypothetical protein LCGC14_2365560, partial [marine sediment metagenome]
STSSSSHNDIAFINRQNAKMHFSTNNTTALTIEADGDVVMSQDLAVTGTLDVTGATTVGTLTAVSASVDELTFDFANDDYKLFARNTGSNDALTIQSQTSGAFSFLELFAKDGDGTDPLLFNIYAQGTPSDVSNSETLSFGYDGTRYIIFSQKAGGGTIHPIRIYTGANTTQLVLNTDNSIDMSGALTVVSFTVPDSVALSSDSAVFQPDTDSTTFFQVLDANGGTPILNVDSTNERVGIGTASPSVSLEVQGSVAAGIFEGIRISNTAAFDSSNFAAFTMQDKNASGNLVNAGVFAASIAAPGTAGSENSFFRIRGLSNGLTITMEEIVFGARQIFYFGDVFIDIDDRVMAWGRTQDYGIGYSNSTDTLNIVDGFSVNTNVRMAIASSGFIGYGGETAPETLAEWTHATPYLTLHNSTHEDTDGGRESRLNFKGEQSGGEETTLARIEVSHDGAVDDQKGEIAISTNDGTDSDTPTERLKIDSAGVFTFTPDADTDLIFNFIGTTDSGVLTWMEDEDYFKFADDVLLDTGVIYLKETTTPTAIANHAA